MRSLSIMKNNIHFHPHQNEVLPNTLWHDFAKEILIFGLENKNWVFDNTMSFDILQTNIISLSKKYHKTYFKPVHSARFSSQRQRKRQKRSGDK